MLSLAIGKEGQNARLAAKLTGWRIQIRSESAAEAVEAGEGPESALYEPFAPGETPDIDIIEEAEEVAAAAEAAADAQPQVGEPAVASVTETGTAAEPAAVPGQEEEDIQFAQALQRMAVPRGEERESEDYGEEDEEDEVYEVPTMIAPDQRPTGIRFAEDVLPKRVEEEDPAKKGAAKKSRRAPRFVEEVDEEMEEIDYSGRIH
jgi:N utilization substance protein A